MGDLFDGGGSSSSDATYGTVASGGGSTTQPQLPTSDGNAPSSGGSVDVMAPPYNGGGNNPSSTGTDWGGILSAGAGIIGAGANLLQQREQNEYNRDKLKAESLSPEAKQVAESTYMQNRQNILAALQNFYAKRGVPMPGAGGGGGGVGSGASVQGTREGVSQQPILGAGLGSTVPLPQSNDAQMAQGQNTPNGQARAANNIGSVLQPNAQAALASRTSTARQPSSGSGGMSTGDKIQAGVTIAQVGKKIYDAAFQKAIDSGATEAQATQAADQAASQQGFTASEIAGYGQGAVTAYRALTNKNATKGQKAVGVAQGANQAYGAAGGEGAGYIGAGLRGANVLMGDQGTAKQRATDAQQEAALGVADMFTYGLASPAVGMFKRTKLGQKTDAMADKLDQKWNPHTTLLAHTISGKSQDQADSDLYRERMRDLGIIKVEPGAKHEEWNIYVPDKNGNLFKYDVGRDGGGGRSAHEFDMSKSFDENGAPTLQGRTTARIMGLSDLIAGGDNKQSSKWGGYFTNAVMNAAQGDEDSGRIAAQSLYRQFGFSNADSAIEGIKRLQQEGKIDDERAAVQIQSIKDTFGVSDAPRENPAQEARPLADRENGKGAAPRDLRSILSNQDDAKNVVQLWRERKKNQMEMA